jgi:hypothetical protein
MLAGFWLRVFFRYRNIEERPIARIFQVIRSGTKKTEQVLERLQVTKLSREVDGFPLIFGNFAPWIPTGFFHILSMSSRSFAVP